MKGLMITHSCTSNYDDATTWTSGCYPFDDANPDTGFWIASSCPYNAQEMLNEIELARLHHIAVMKADQKRWWFEAINKRILLYNVMISFIIIFHKILRCNRKGIGLRIRA